MDDTSLILVILGIALLLILSAITLLLIIGIILFAVTRPALVLNTRVPKRLSRPKREHREGNIPPRGAQEPSVHRPQQPRVQDSDIEIVYADLIAEEIAL